MVMAWNIPNEDLQALRKAIEDGLSLERVLKVERVNDDSTGISIANLTHAQCPAHRTGRARTASFTMAWRQCHLPPGRRPVAAFHDYLTPLPKPGSGTSDNDDSRSGSTVVYIASMSAGSNRIRRDGVTTCRTRPDFAHRRRVSGETPTSLAASPALINCCIFCSVIPYMMHPYSVTVKRCHCSFCSVCVLLQHDNNEGPARTSARRSDRHDNQSTLVCTQDVWQ